MLLALAGMLPASFHPPHLATAREVFHLSENCKVNEGDNAEAKEKRVRLKIADLN